MKKLETITLLLMLFFAHGIYAQTATAPTTGDGTANNPYRITSLNNLYWISASDAVVSSPTYTQRMSGHYVQMNDINASSTST